MSITIPTPDEASRLRFTTASNPRVRGAVIQVSTRVAPTDAEAALAALDAQRPWLSDAEVRAVVAHFVVAPPTPDDNDLAPAVICAARRRRLARRGSGWVHAEAADHSARPRGGGE